MQPQTANFHPAPSSMNRRYSDQRQEHYLKHVNILADSSPHSPLLPSSTNGGQTDHADYIILHEIFEKRQFTSHFQPIVSITEQRIFGHEALCRIDGPNPFDNIDTLFQQARIHGLTMQLDMLCRENGILLAAEKGIDQLNSLLFLNICPTSLLHENHNTGTTELYVKESGLLKENIVLEITEQEAVSNYRIFKTAIDHYRNCGFKIAIDDFGAGYGGLKMLSVLEPDYVKIDQHFFRSHKKSHINYNLIDAIATACHRIGIEVIAEGIETEHDLRVCREIGIDLLQGYYFAKPAPDLVTEFNYKEKPAVISSSSTTKLFDEVICVGDICSYIVPASIDDRVLEILNRFNSTPELYCIPVLSKGLLCGLINRNRFMEKHMVGRTGYGMSLNYYKKVGDLLEEDFLQVPNYMSVEEVARKIHLRQHISTYDDICITRSGKYIGTVSVSSILNAVTENSMMLAKNANPLTGLPGNEYIQRQIAKMLSQSIHFDVCYLDIDSFKPFNDSHGFEMGDRVIKKLGDILVESTKKYDKSTISFAGHIGGDDFIIITRPKHSIETCEFIVDTFTKERDEFHSRKATQAGYYLGVDRKGKKEKFQLLSISIGIVSTEVHHITSFAEISSIATDLKKRAKQIKGSSIVRDRRIIQSAA